MTPRGTQAHLAAAENVPPLVRRALDASRGLGFDEACLPQVGRLLQLLAGTASGTVGETGTGCGVGLAWLASGAPAGTRFVGVEADERRAAAARRALADHPGVTVLHGDASELFAHGPFDLLFLDGGPGSGEHGDDPVEPVQVLTPGGVLVLDDFVPVDTWPPRGLDGSVERSLTHWLDHPALFSTVVRLAPGDPPFTVLVATRRPAAAARPADRPPDHRDQLRARAAHTPRGSSVQGG